MIASNTPIRGPDGYVPDVPRFLDQYDVVLQTTACSTG